MIYISIPVHEKPEVVVNQMQNFARYLPEANVVLHVSKGAKFSVNELEDALKKANVSNALINPTQVETKWGSIIQAHLANIRYIIKQGDAEKVIFHSSNDMLIMDGLSEYLKDKKNIFHLRKCASDSLWWVSKRAVKDFPVLTFFNHKLYASQIEGSMYDIVLLKKLVSDLDKQDLILDSELFYPREEIVFSSFAYKEDIKPDGLPYVFSEVHMFDRVFFKYMSLFPILFLANNPISKGLKKILELLLMQCKKSITLDIIDKIITRNNNLDSMCILDDSLDKHLMWLIYNKDALFGVKRVERDLLDPIRITISTNIL